MSDNSANDGNGGCLISVLPLGFGAADASERIQLTRQYLSTHLSYPDVGDAEVWQDRVPTLEDDTFEDGWRRLHFDAASGFCLFFDAHGCSIVDTKDKRSARVETQPYVELGGVLFGWEAPPNAERAFVLMDGEAFHSRVEELLNDSDCVLHHSVLFLAMDELERRRHVFGCEAGEFGRMIEFLKLALLLELVAGGGLHGWREATWRPWREDALIEGEGAGEVKLNADVPQRLLKWLEVIGKVIGCKLRDDIGCDGGGLHEFARSWAGGFRVSAKRPSAHEVVVAWARLNETVG